MDTEKLKELVAKASQLPWEDLGREVFSRGNNRTVAEGPDFYTSPCAFGQWPANAALIVAAVNALPSLLAELEAARKDAGRWRHARKLLTVDDIEGAQGAFDSFGGIVSESECLRADTAIDTAMEAQP